MNRRIGAFFVGAVVLVSLAVLANAEDQPLKGQYRIYLNSGHVVSGDVTQQADGSYEVKNKYGMTIVVRKHEVKAIVPLEENGPRADQPSPGQREESISPYRRAISDEEIAEILAGIEAELSEDDIRISDDDLDAELPLNEEHLAEMKRQAGEKAKVLVRPHFVMVYTGTAESAQELGSRLEVIWKWNFRFINMLGLKPKRPDYKLEVYYFGTHEEFKNYALNNGSDLPDGVLGYYTHDVNRSHFFDLWDWPVFEQAKRAIKDKQVPADTRRHLRNKINRWVEHNNHEVIQHEAGHHIHFNTGIFTQRGDEGGLAPTWLVEGTTMMFEVPQSTTGRGGACLGDLNDARLDEFRRAYPKWTPAGLKQFVIINQLWYQGYNYPRGWAIVYYLWMQHREGLGKYVKKIHDREELGEEYTLTDREADFEECFGRLDQEWVDKFYAYLDGLTVRKSRLPPEPF